MIIRKSKYELKLMKGAGEIVAMAHEAVKEAIKEGVSTWELDEIVYNLIIKNNKFSIIGKANKTIAIFPPRITLSAKLLLPKSLATEDASRYALLPANGAGSLENKPTSAVDRVDKPRGADDMLTFTE